MLLLSSGCSFINSSSSSRRASESVSAADSQSITEYENVMASEPSPSGRCSSSCCIVAWDPIPSGSRVLLVAAAGAPRKAATTNWTPSHAGPPTPPSSAGKQYSLEYRVTRSCGESSRKT